MYGERYKIIRFFKNGGPRVIKKNLTLAEVHDHCGDPETSSSTAKSAKARRYTATHGPWFDGFDKM
jgi:hypothetical protein